MRFFPPSLHELTTKWSSKFFALDMIFPIVCVNSIYLSSASKVIDASTYIREFTWKCCKFGVMQIWRLSPTTAFPNRPGWIIDSASAFSPLLYFLSFLLYFSSSSSVELVSPHPSILPPVNRRRSYLLLEPCQSDDRWPPYSDHMPVNWQSPYMTVFISPPRPLYRYSS